MVASTISKPAIILPAGGVRCWNCGKKFAWLVTAPYRIDCRHCGATNEEHLQT